MKTSIAVAVMGVFIVSAALFRVDCVFAETPCSSVRDLPAKVECINREAGRLADAVEELQKDSEKSRTIVKLKAELDELKRNYDKFKATALSRDEVRLSCTHKATGAGESAISMTGLEAGELVFGWCSDGSAGALHEGNNSWTCYGGRPAAGKWVEAVFCRIVQK